VKLLRCQILGFGKLSDLELDFRDGLNLVFAANEGGKSTLQRCLVGLLYGQMRADLPSQRRLDAWVEQYEPWYVDAYGGILWCRLQNGREIEIHRSFGRDESRIEIRSATGEVITEDYEQQKNGDVLFARSHLGLPKDLFDSVAVIRESRLAELPGRDSIRDRIANLAQAGAEELSIRQSLARLEKALEDIGSDRAPTKPYMQSLDQLISLEAEAAALASRRSEYQMWVEERSKLAADAERLERAETITRRAVLTARFREAEGRIRALEELARELDSLSAELEPLRGYTSFPAHGLEEVNQLSGAHASLEKSLAEKRVRLREADEQVWRAYEARKQVEAFGSVDAEMLSDWFVHYLSLTVKRDEAQQSLNQILDETLALEKSLGQLAPSLQNPEVDWQRRAREASEAERAASDKCLRMEGQIAGLRARQSRIAARRSKLMLSGSAAVLMALASIAVRSLIGADTMPVLLTAGLFAFLVATAVGLISAGARLRPELERIEKEVRSIEADQSRARDEGQTSQREILQVVQESGYGSLEEFLGAAKQAERSRQRHTDLAAGRIEKERLRDKLQAECDEIFSRLKEALGAVGLSCSPGNIKTQIDLMRSNVRRFRDCDAEWRRHGELAASLGAEEARLSGELAGKKARIEVILSEAGVETPEGFRSCCRKRQLASELLEKESSRTREFHRLCGGVTLEAWRDRARDLDETLRKTPGSLTDPSPAEPGSCSPDGGSLYLPYEPDVEEAEREEKLAVSRLAAVREEYARVVERVSRAFQSYRTASEIEEDLALVRRRVSELSTNRDALRTALETLQLLVREQQEVLAPQLNGAVEQRFLRLCDCRYEEVLIDPEFGIYLREARSGEVRAVERLSRGTQDQLYFALRFGILDLVSNPEEPCPCLLDEPFAAYDHRRIIEAFRILDEEARRRQLLVFSCREDLRELAQSQGAHMIVLP
jgi:energy-coupling factor transporter ATP-binding protein EcfA2